MLEKELWQRIPFSPAGKQGGPAAFHTIIMNMHSPTSEQSKSEGHRTASQRVTMGDSARCRVS